MIEAGLLPAARVMAARAIGAVLPHVRVIPRVTGKAGARRMLVGIAGAMAAGTRRTGMTADQGKAGCRMIERCRLPRTRVVTARAVGSATAIVRVVAGVARYAAGLKPLPALPGMA